MKKIKYLILSALIFTAVLLLASCAKEAHSYIWYIDSYVKDGVSYRSVSPEDTLNHFAVCTDKVKLSFSEDGTFRFTDHTGTAHSGTYTSDKGKISAAYKINMTFEDGRSASAACTASSPRHSTLTAQIFGVTYVFKCFDPDFCTEDEYNAALKRIAVSVRDASRADAAVYETGGLYYHKGEIEKRDGKFFLSFSNREVNLSDGRTVYPYYIDEKDNLSYAELSAGSCIVREENEYGARDLAVYYLSSNETYIRDELGFADIYDWLKQVASVHDIDEIAYVFDKGSIAPGHLQEARLANYSEREAIVNYLLNTKLTYAAGDTATDVEEGAPVNFVIVTVKGVPHKINLTNYHVLNAYAYKPAASFPAVADRGTNYVNIDTHLIHREIFKNGVKLSNTDVDLSCIILSTIDTYDGADLDFTTDCTYVSDVAVNIIDARHVQYEGVLYEVIGEYDFSGCFSPTDSRGYSILTVKNSADGSVILTVKYDTGRVLDKESILSTALTDGIYADSEIYTDEALREELTALTLSSNSVIYVSLENQE